MKSCTICAGEKNVEILVDHEDFHIVKCAQCGLVYQSNSGQRKEIRNVYDNIYEAAPGADAADVLKNIEKCGRTGADSELICSEVEQYHRLPGTMLDIGCSYGLLTALFQSRGWKAIGIDLCEVAVKWAMAHGLNCMHTSVEDYQPTEKFDAIIMNHVLEHCADPAAVLLKVKTWLADRGTIHIRVPNVESKIIRSCKTFFIGELKPFEHLYYFSPDTIAMLLGKAGLECSVTTQGKYGLGSIINMLVRRSLVTRSSWHELNYRTPIGKKGSYLRLKRLYETVLQFTNLVSLGENDREIAAVAFCLGRC